MNIEKDTNALTDNSSIALNKTISPISYNKTNKLITALYMVTDVIDKQEPLRHKLRTLGTEVISDINSNFSPDPYHLNYLVAKTDEILSFLEIAVSLNLISTMNSSILKKEFGEFRESIVKVNPNLGLVDLFKEERNIPNFNNQITYIGQNKSTRIGVQRGNTLMKALSDRMEVVSDRKNDFDVLKKHRREDIIKVIKNSQNIEGLTITDIKNMAKNFEVKLGVQALASCSEKTLQRELFSMVKDGVLNKTGSKRWSKYFLPR